MPSISLTLPTAGTVITAGLHATNYTSLQTLLNGGLDTANWASGKIFAPSKLMQEAAAVGQILEWNGTSWVPYSPPSARAFHNANQSIANNTAGVAVALNSERYDTDTIHDTAVNNSRLTCKTAGKYLIVANIEWATNATGQRILAIVLNGATTLGSDDRPGTAAGPIRQCVTTMYDLAVNDYVEMTAFQDSGGGLNVQATGNFSPEFSMVRVA